MGNHFHLAVETPQGNSSDGLRWLQATFANRFNRFRKETGRLFQGRFKSLVVEHGERLAWLCHYIHLNPVRSGLCPLEQLGEYSTPGRGAEDLGQGRRGDRTGTQSRTLESCDRGGAQRTVHLHKRPDRPPPGLGHGIRCQPLRHGAEGRKSAAGG